jgi:hypothetical protein
MRQTEAASTSIDSRDECERTVMGFLLYDRSPAVFPYEPATSPGSIKRDAAIRPRSCVVLHRANAASAESLDEYCSAYARRSTKMVCQRELPETVGPHRNPTGH